MRSSVAEKVSLVLSISGGNDRSGLVEFPDRGAQKIEILENSILVTLSLMKTSTVSDSIMKFFTRLSFHGLHAGWSPPRRRPLQDQTAPRKSMDGTSTLAPRSTVAANIGWSCCPLVTSRIGRLQRAKKKRASLLEVQLVSTICQKTDGCFRTSFFPQALQRTLSTTKLQCF